MAQLLWNILERLDYSVMRLTGRLPKKTAGTSAQAVVPESSAPADSPPIEPVKIDGNPGPI